MAEMHGAVRIFISATDKQNIATLRDLLHQRAKTILPTRYPHPKDLLFGDRNGALPEALSGG